MENTDKFRDDVFSRVVKAGKRTYFFDVKATRNDQLFLIVTESKKNFDPQTNQYSYQKHKIFIFHEDLDKFRNALLEVVEYVNLQRPAPLPNTTEESFH